ncbi:elongator complex protein 3 [Alkalibacter mobilis]|uniref:elongator complex protein 3 n=1 Tax=Alkalibacter mobilis TaxID=2787712 RepID=UPI00189DD584|nr:radical SAM protein [Alkalibacter mobilis]MBF7095836.1 radical SAM protein [Alkalibacter mobilis]
MKNKIIPVFIPHEGCPHDCSFCNQKKISGAVKTPSLKEIQNIIDDYIKSNRNDEIAYTLAYYGGSFTAIEIELQNALLKLAGQNIDEGKINDIRISTRPDYLEKDDVKRLSAFGNIHVEIGIQSTDNEVLNLSNRNYDLNIIKRAVKNLNEENMSYGFQIMVGMMSDNEQKLYKTTTELLKLKPKTMRIYPCIVIKETLLEKQYEMGTFMPLSLNEAIEAVKIPYTIFTNHNVPIIRIGLHASKSLTEGGEIVAGPYHPSFGEILISSIYLDMLRKSCDVHDLKSGELIIHCPVKLRSKIVGNRSFVIKTLSEEMDLKIRFVHADDLEGRLTLEFEGKSYLLDLRTFLLEKEKYYNWKFNVGSEGFAPEEN